MAAAVHVALVVQLREHAPLLAIPRAQHEVYLREAVVVARYETQLDALDVLQLQRPWRSFELDPRRPILSRRDLQRVGLRNQHVSEARCDAQTCRVLQRPASDHAARTIAHERHFALTIAQHELALRVTRHAAHAEHTSARLLVGETLIKSALSLTQVV